jgi:predicted component of type VI protein secretion system
VSTLATADEKDLPSDNNNAELAAAKQAKITKKNISYLVSTGGAAHGKRRCPQTRRPVSTLATADEKDLPSDNNNAELAAAKQAKITKKTFHTSCRRASRRTAHVAAGRLGPAEPTRADVRRLS